MKVREIMTPNPATCKPTTNIQEVAKLMVDCDCGAIPVIETNGSSKPVGIITDRDIVARIIARGQNPLLMRVVDAMTRKVVSVSPDTDLEEAIQVMKDNQVRRLVVKGDDGCCAGILAQADLARHVSEALTGDVVEEISTPSQDASRPAAVA